MLRRWHMVGRPLLTDSCSHDYLTHHDHRSLSLPVLAPVVEEALVVVGPSNGRELDKLQLVRERGGGAVIGDLHHLQAMTQRIRGSQSDRLLVQPLAPVLALAMSQCALEGHSDTSDCSVQIYMDYLYLSLLFLHPVPRMDAWMD